MRQQVNYIEHQRSVYLKMSEDTQLSAIHISLYFSLFMIWNECGFDTELSINRNDIMRLSKIGSANTYTTSLKQLHEYGYIIYKPSFNPLIGSKVTIIKFDKGSNNGTNNGSVKGSSKGSDTLYKQVNKETDKLINIEFDIFWSLYDKKKGDKDACQKKWEKLGNEEREKIILTLPDFKKQITEKKYQPLPVTYLHQKRWNDEIETQKSETAYTPTQNTEW